MPLGSGEQTRTLTNTLTIRRHELDRSTQFFKELDAVCSVVGRFIWFVKAESGNGNSSGNDDNRGT